MYRILIDRSLCSGFGACIEQAPDSIVLDDGGIASVRLCETNDRAALEAAAACPMGAITVEEREAA
ncbi:MAG TPA: ferredoxin [Gaiellaceae bacterium]|nr:ferredoxin [Gaiellaceae bacterium]